MPGAIGPDPRQRVVVQHAAHDVHAVTVVFGAADQLALVVVVMRHVEAAGGAWGGGGGVRLICFFVCLSFYFFLGYGQEELHFFFICIYVHVGKYI